MDDNSAAIILLLVVGYMLPGIVASARRHRNRLAIGMLNLLLGWTLLGWIGALVWACTADIEPQVARAPRAPRAPQDSRAAERR